MLPGPLPVVVSLHGRAESEDGPLRSLGAGLPARLIANASSWPVAAVIPWKPDPSMQWEDVGEGVLRALDAVLEMGEPATDASRVYLTGYGQGGHGTWRLAARWGDRFAAIVPIGGFVTAPLARTPNAARGPQGSRAVEVLAGEVAPIPAWIFHGKDDPVVPSTESEAMHEALLARGSECRLTLYEGSGHGAWERAYAEGELPAWLFTHRLTS